MPSTSFGTKIAVTPFRTENWFIPLYFVVYRELWDNVSISDNRGPKRLPRALAGSLLNAAEALADVERLPTEVRDAISGAATDAARRNTRLDLYLTELVG